MRSSTIVWVIIILLILGGGVWYLSQTPAVTTDININPTTTPNTNTGTSGATTSPATTTGTSSNATTSGSTSAPMTATVTYTASGFSPKSVTIARGGTVTFVNEGGSSMWVASARHPDHTVYSGTNLQAHCDDATDVSFDQCKTGNNYSFKFDKAGSWNYHNHAKAQDFGTVVVQ